MNLIEEITGPVTIMVSGGADSALLLYMLLSQHTDETHVITMTNNKKFYRNLVPAENVVKFCADATGNDNITHTVVRVEEQTDTGLRSIINESSTELVIMGITDLPAANSGMAIPILPSHDPRMMPKPRSFKIGKVYVPLINLNKRDIANKYEELALTDTLFPLTTSCESIHPVTGHCGECWWCQERLHAFGRL